MNANHIENLTLSELKEFYSNRSKETYNTYISAIHEEDELTKDQSYKNWTHADDCLLSVNRILEQAKLDLF